YNRGRGFAVNLLPPLGALMMLVLVVTPAYAETRTPAEATAHALEELANACAQRRPECPTSTPTATLEPTSTATVIPTGTPTPTDEPAPTVTPAPEPCWLTDADLGDPNSG